MTTKEVYSAVLYELNKVNSPTFRLGSFNYFLHKALLDFTNDSYKRYALTQEITDDIRALTRIEIVNLLESNRVLYSNIPYTDITLSADGKQVISIIFDSSIYYKYLTVGSHIQISNTYLISTIDSITTLNSSITATVSSVNYDSTKPALSISDAYVSVMDMDYKTMAGASGGTVRQFTLSADDYMHPLGVSCNMLISKDGTSCNSSSNTYPLTRGVKRATFDIQTNIIWNDYLKPSYRRMFYYVYNSSLNSVNRVSGTANTTAQNTPVFKIFMGDPRVDVLPESIEISYLHLPGSYKLTEAQIYNFNSDVSQVIELPDYTKPDIVKRTVLWLMGTEGDRRIQLEAQLNVDNRQTNQQTKK